MNKNNYKQTWLRYRCIMYNTSGLDWSVRFTFCYQDSGYNNAWNNFSPNQWEVVTGRTYYQKHWTSVLQQFSDMPSLYQMMIFKVFCWENEENDLVSVSQSSFISEVCGRFGCISCVMLVSWPEQLKLRIVIVKCSPGGQPVCPPQQPSHPDILRLRFLFERFLYFSNNSFAVSNLKQGLFSN